MSCTKLSWYDWRLWYVTIKLSIPELMEQKDSQTRLGCLTSLVYNIILKYIVRSKGKEMDKLTHRLWCKHVEGQYHLGPRMGNIQISSLNLCHIRLPHLMVWVWRPEMGLQWGEPQTEVSWANDTPLLSHIDGRQVCLVIAVVCQLVY